MRRSVILASALAITTAVSAACDPPKSENKPVSTPTPAATTTPAPAATGSPAASPGTSPDAKKDEAKPTADGQNVNKDVKPAASPAK
ncbi:MAG: hypothetical protein AB7J13_14280 [Pyrinomonadaceae bacterium]